MTTIEAIEVLKNNQCFCGRGKRYKTAFCNDCYRTLSPTLRSDLYRTVGDGFEQSYQSAKNLLGKINDSPGVLKGQCEKCGKIIAFLRQKKDDGTFGEPNPIELEPHLKGNLVLNLQQRLYRYATPAELELARTENKNLYVSHFAFCPHARSFSRREQKSEK